MCVSRDVDIDKSTRYDLEEMYSVSIKIKRMVIARNFLVA